jgi:hypothetical protein
MEAGFVGEQDRRIQVIEDGDVDLAGAAAFGIDDESGGGGVALGEIAGENIEPVALGGRAGGGGVFEKSTDGELASICSWTE